tara:strand:+ start:292 stop:1167 length:876 start_codon:yes stop_codon:yes gene_type:complete
MKKIFIFGAYGFLGSYLCKFLKKKGYKVFKQGRGIKSQIVLRPSNTKKIEKTLLSINPQIIINLIAETDVKKCETNLKNAKFVNAGIVKNIVSVIKKINKKQRNLFLIHISTDSVYGNMGPHNENNIKLINNYAKTKFLGELEARKTKSAILRTNFIGKNSDKKHKPLSDWIINSLKKRKKIKVFNDVLFSPLHLSSLSKAIEIVLRKKITGTYNVGARGYVSKASFAHKLCKHLELDENLLEKTNYSQSKFIVKRPLDMRMKTKKFEKIYKMVLPRISDQIRLTAREYKK